MNKIGKPSISPNEAGRKLTLKRLSLLAALSMTSACHSTVVVDEKQQPTASASAHDDCCDLPTPTAHPYVPPAKDNGVVSGYSGSGGKGPGHFGTGGTGGEGGVGGQGGKE